jgi:hypothetical protein
VLSPHRANFLKTMLRLAGDRDRISVVADQFGCPTSARDIAQALATITLRMIADTGAPTGVYHFVNAGDTSWSGSGAGDLRAKRPPRRRFRRGDADHDGRLSHPGPAAGQFPTFHRQDHR